MVGLPSEMSDLKPFWCGHASNDTEGTHYVKCKK